MKSYIKSIEVSRTVLQLNTQFRFLNNQTTLILYWKLLMLYSHVTERSFFLDLMSYRPDQYLKIFSESVWEELRNLALKIKKSWNWPFLTAQLIDREATYKFLIMPDCQKEIGALLYTSQWLLFGFLWVPIEISTLFWNLRFW